MDGKVDVSAAAGERTGICECRWNDGYVGDKVCVS